MLSVLKLDKVTKVFNKGSSDEKKAINNLSLEVNDGDFITIIGVLKSCDIFWYISVLYFS